MLQKLVGFRLPQKFVGDVPLECNLVIEKGDIAGRVTSIAWSAIVGRHIGLAFVRPDMAEVGRDFTIKLTNASLVTAQVCSTPFFDPKGERQQDAALVTDVVVNPLSASAERDTVKEIA